MIFPLVLGCDRRLVGVDAENSEVVQKTPHPFFLLYPRGTRTPHEFPEHHAFRQSRVLHTRHKSREQDPPLAQYRLDALAPRPHEDFEVGDRVVGAIALSPSDLLPRHPCEDGEREHRGDTAQEAYPVRGVCGAHGGHERLPKRVMFGELVGDVGSAGGQEKEWMGYLLDDLRVFGIHPDKWTIAAQDEGDDIGRQNKGRNLS